jgi:hypothetical protein
MDQVFCHSLSSGISSQYYDNVDNVYPDVDLSTFPPESAIFALSFSFPNILIPFHQLDAAVRHRFARVYRHLITVAAGSSLLN